MEKGNMKIFSIVISIIVVVVSVIMIISNEKRNFLLLFVLLLILINLIYFKSAKQVKIKHRIILWSINTIIISVIATIDSTGLSIVLFLVQVGEAVINTSFMLSTCITLVNYLTYLVIMDLLRGGLSFYEVAVISINFAFSYIAMSGVRHEIIEKGEAQAIATQLEAKSKELERAYKKLQELYEEKEEVILLKERNRIAGEIHDTVGHILTTVVIEIEASKRLINKDRDLAVEKLNLAQGQVRQGLEDIRKLVRAFKEGEDIIDFTELLKAFIGEVEKSSEVAIDYSFTNIPILDKKIENILYKALQEGITNGIRHGNSKNFQFLLCYVSKKVKFTLKDYGKGFDEINLGFGLYNMKSKVEAVGGIFNINSIPNEGVTIKIEIPVVEVIR